MRNLLLTIALFFAGTSAVLADDIHFRLSPNPASSHVNVQFENPVIGDFTVEIYSVLGTRLMHQTYHEAEGATTVMLNTANLADGIYLIRVTRGEESIVKRIKIQQG